MIALLAVNVGKPHGSVKIERPLHNFRCLVLRLYPAATHHTPPAPQLRLLLVVFSFVFSFQFFTRLAAVFAEEVGDVSGVLVFDGQI